MSTMSEHQDKSSIDLLERYASHLINLSFVAYIYIYFLFFFLWSHIQHFHKTSLDGSSDVSGAIYPTVVDNMQGVSAIIFQEHSFFQSFWICKCIIHRVLWVPKLQQLVREPTVSCRNAKFMKKRGFRILPRSYAKFTNPKWKRIVVRNFRTILFPYTIKHGRTMSKQSLDNVQMIFPWCSDSVEFQWFYIDCD